MRIKVLGFDPSYTNFGIAQAWIDINTLEVEPISLKLVSTEVDKTKQLRKTSDDLRRVRVLHQAVDQEYKESQASMVMSEATFFSQNSAAMKSAGICLGILANAPVPLIEVSAIQSKVALTGKQSAEKSEMIKAAMAKYPDLNWLKGKGGNPAKKNEHLADAIAAILAGIKTQAFLEAVAIFRSLAPSYLR